MSKKNFSFLSVCVWNGSSKEGLLGLSKLGNTLYFTWFAKFTECRMKPRQLLAGSKNMALILYLYIQMHHHKVLRVQLHLTANLVLLMSIIVIYKKGRGGW